MSEAFDKKSLSEQDICTKYITPAVASAGWDMQSQIREEVTFTAGWIVVKGTKTKRGESKRADYILYYKPNIPIAVIEAKDNNHSVRAGMQQALGYVTALDVPFAFSSNGDAFLEDDRTAGQGRSTHGSVRRTGNQTRPVPNRRRRPIPRSRFDQDLLFSFGAAMTVCQIKRNNAEERIFITLNSGQKESLRSYVEKLIDKWVMDRR